MRFQWNGICGWEIGRGYSMKGHTVFVMNGDNSSGLYLMFSRILEAEIESRDGEIV